MAHPADAGHSVERHFAAAGLRNRHIMRGVAAIRHNCFVRNAPRIRYAVDSSPGASERRRFRRLLYQETVAVRWLGFGRVSRARRRQPASRNASGREACVCLE